jgi:hypothetical protein
MRLDSAAHLLVVLSATIVAGQQSNGDENDRNMNGDDYVLSATPNSDSTARLFPKRYADYPKRKTRYVDVYSPEISTLYSQVFWKRLETVPLPSYLVDEFDNKGMAIVGFEVDQVIRDSSGNGDNDVSVPISVTYNHHYEATVLGKDARMKKVQADDPLLAETSHMGHGHAVEKDGSVWVVQDMNPGSTLPNHQDIGAGNGGEFRKTFHGFPPGYAKIVSSPRAMSITPMEIDTWNRSAISWMDIINGNGSTFVPGIVPRNSLAPKDGVDAVYSGLLECPLTTRITKIIEELYDKKVSSHCPTPIQTPEDCFAAIGNLTFGFENEQHLGWNRSTVRDASLPSGCVAMLSSSNEHNSMEVVFNELKDSVVECGEGSHDVYSGQTSSLVDVGIQLNLSNATAIVSLSGPSDVWFGVGFNATGMANEPWAIIVEGNGDVTEHKLGDQGGGGTETALPPSITVISNEVVDFTRTVVFSRPLQGMDARYYTFGKDVTDLHFINAIGSTSKLSYHKEKTASMVTVLPRNREPICICSNPPPPFGQARGTLVYQDGSVVGFSNKCPASPRGDLLDQRNPTCDIRTFRGGQNACRHLWSLLDADQEIPWLDQPLKYHLKFRIWFQEYDRGYHKSVYRTTWGIGSPVEYDVPQCPAGTQTDACIHTITGTFNVGQPSDGKMMRLVAAHFHCHAPSCLSVELYNNRTGELLCREVPIYGSSQNHGDTFEEPGFIAIPPCLFGDVAHGLESPPLVSGQRLHAIKTANSTYGHHGEMAWLQVLYMLEDEEESVNS